MASPRMRAATSYWRTTALLAHAGSEWDGSRCGAAESEQLWLPVAVCGLAPSGWESGVLEERAAARSAGTSSAINRPKRVYDPCREQIPAAIHMSRPGCLALLAASLLAIASRWA